MIHLNEISLFLLRMMLDLQFRLFLPKNSMEFVKKTLLEIKSSTFTLINSHAIQENATKCSMYPIQILYLNNQNFWVTKLYLSEFQLQRDKWRKFFPSHTSILIPNHKILEFCHVFSWLKHVKPYKFPFHMRMAIHS